MVNMAVLVVKMSIFPIFSYEQGECNATFRAHQVLKNGFHLITTSFYDQKSVLSPKEEISRNNFYNPLEQCAVQITPRKKITNSNQTMPSNTISI